MNTKQHYRAQQRAEQQARLKARLTDADITALDIARITRRLTRLTRWFKKQGDKV